MPTLTHTLFQELRAISRAYTGCPDFAEEYWTTDQVLGHLSLILLLQSDGTEVSPSPLFTGTDWLKICHEAAPLSLFPDADGYVDSHEVLRCINVFVSTLKDYKNSRVEEPGIELTLENELTSLWLLPVVPVDNKQGDRIYYLIANGQGNWRRLSPAELEA